MVAVGQGLLFAGLPPATSGSKTATARAIRCAPAGSGPGGVARRRAAGFGERGQTGRLAIGRRKIVLLEQHWILPRGGGVGPRLAASPAASTRSNWRWAASRSPAQQRPPAWMRTSQTWLLWGSLSASGHERLGGGGPIFRAFWHRPSQKRAVIANRGSPRALKNGLGFARTAGA